MLLRVAILCLICAAPTARADTSARLETAFRTWVASSGASAAVMVVQHRGVPVQTVTVNRPREAVMELASVGKSITAVCAAHLVKDGVWRMTTTSADVLGKGPLGLTLARLLTHHTGLGPDQTQVMMPLWLGAQDNRAGAAADRALMRDIQTGTPGTYLYNNENYAVLGEMIAAQTGQPYETYCQATVLAPAGVTTAQASDATKAFLPYGGWSMSAQDFARFFWHAYGPKGIIGKDVDGWPAGQITGAVSYGMGMVQRPFAGSQNIWHFGALCFPGRFNIGSYVVMWQQEWSVSAGYDVCASDAQMIELDHLLSRAVFP